LERDLGVDARARGNEVRLVGDADKAELARKVLEELYGVVRSGGEVHARDVRQAVRMVTEEPDVNLGEVYEDILSSVGGRRRIKAKNLNQRRYIEAMRKSDVVFAVGPAGTGKTMMARAIAHELDATFFVISPAQILSKWVGEAEQNLKKLFDAAKAEVKSVIFMDEIEALVPRRKSGGSSVMQRVVPQLLQELEGFEEDTTPLLFVGATNKPWMLDDAMMRPGRLDARIYVPLPDAPARFKLLEIYMNKRPLAEDVDFGELCDKLEGYSGADIASIAEQAARFAFMESIAGKDSRQITMQDILKVIEATLPSVKPADLARYERFTETGR